MTTSRFKRVSINLDSTSRNKCKILADDQSTSISGVLRLLIKRAFEEHQRVSNSRISSESCIQP
jgi:hypothetical protein